MSVGKLRTHASRVSANHGQNAVHLRENTWKIQIFLRCVQDLPFFFGVPPLPTSLTLTPVPKSTNKLAPPNQRGILKCVWESEEVRHLLQSAGVRRKQQARGMTIVRRAWFLLPCVASALAYEDEKATRPNEFKKWRQNTPPKVRCLKQSVYVLSPAWNPGMCTRCALLLHSVLCTTAEQTDASCIHREGVRRGISNCRPHAATQPWKRADVHLATLRWRWHRSKLPTHPAHTKRGCGFSCFWGPRKR